MREASLDMSAIVPLGQRVDDVPQLLDEYSTALRSTGLSFEIIVVVDGPHGHLGAELVKLEHSSDRLRVIQLSREFGESVALSVGLSEVRGKAIMTLPGYHQVVPSELVKLVEAARVADMVVGVRWPRSGSLLAKVRRGVFHGFLKLLTGQLYRDLGCGMRLLKREVAEEIPLYSDRHHFYPLLAWSRGFQVREVEVTQAPKDTYRGPRSMRQYLHRLLDMLTLFFLVRFTKKPLRFFGTVGSVVFAVGTIFLLVLVYQRIVLDIGLADRPALLLSSLMLVLGVQIFALGLLGELIIFTHAGSLKEYSIRRIIDSESVEDSK